MYARHGLESEGLYSVEHFLFVDNNCELYFVYFLSRSIASDYESRLEGCGCLTGCLFQVQKRGWSGHQKKARGGPCARGDPCAWLRKQILYNVNCMNSMRLK